MHSPVPLLDMIALPAISLACVLTLGGTTIGWLRRVGAGQRVRDDGPQRHLTKEGTPTMGGVLIVGAMLLPWLIVEAPVEGFWDWDRLAPLAVLTLVFAGIGLADDLLKIRRGRSLGLKARQKLGLQLLAAALYLGMRWPTYEVLPLPGDGSSSVRPYLTLDVIAWAVFWVLAIVATSNAMNLADGLDGLASGLCVIGAGGLAVLGLAAGDRVVTLLGLALAGACLGFLWFNRHPARLFMGDVGSLALGAAMAGMTAELRAPLALLGLCLVPFLEEASVIGQVISFKTTGKRIFRMSPIHHHFELLGWSEQRVVWTFWIVAAVAAAVTVGVTLASRG